MALLKLKEFAAECGVTSSYLSVDISRKKIVVTMIGDEKMIEDTNEKNAAYLAKKQRNKATAAVETGSDPVSDAPIATAVHSRKTKPDNITPDKAHQLELREQALDIEIKEQKARYEKIKADKAEGLVIPTELVKALMLQHSKSISIEFKNAIDDFITIMGAKYRMTPADISEIRKKSLDTLNNSIKKSSIATKEQLKNIVAEYSDTRARGEHD